MSRQVANRNISKKQQHSWYQTWLLPTWLRALVRNAREKLLTFRHWLWRNKGLYATTWSLLVGAPPFLVVNYYSVEAVSDEIKLGIPLLATILDSNPLRWLALAALWAWSCDRLKRWLSSRLHDEPSGWESASTILLSALGNVVGYKQQRFQTALVEATKLGRADAAELFDQITKPDLQIREIMQAVYVAFDSLLRQDGQQRAQLKVNLAVINNSEVVKILYHYPHDRQVRSTIAQLNNPRSAIKTAIRKRRLVVIESMRDEG